MSCYGTQDAQQDHPRKHRLLYPGQPLYASPRIQSLRLRICFSQPCVRGAQPLAAASDDCLFFCHDAGQECLATSGPKMRSSNIPANEDCCRSAAALPLAYSHCAFASAFPTPAFEVRNRLLQQATMVFSSAMQGRNVLLRRDPRCAAGTSPQTCLCESLSANISCPVCVMRSRVRRTCLEPTWHHVLLPSWAIALHSSRCEPQGITCVGWHMHLQGRDVLRAHWRLQPVFLPVAAKSLGAVNA